LSDKRAEKSVSRERRRQSKQHCMDVYEYMIVGVFLLMENEISLDLCVRKRGSQSKHGANFNELNRKYL
jgi:hypothetical protein